MGLMLTNIRIENFRSLEYVDVKLGKTNVLIGQNNSGKSNFLKAIDISLGSYREISDKDIYVSEGERLSQDKKAIIDILLRPVDENGIVQTEFTSYWMSVFTEQWITTDETNGDYVGIRTIIQFDSRKNEYVVERWNITQWTSEIKTTKVGKKRTFGSDMMDMVTSFYMDAHRDIVDDIKNKKSYFGKITSPSGLTEEMTMDLENQLNAINQNIIQNIPTLHQTNESLSMIKQTMNSTSGLIEIEPLARKISDLHKGMDIIYKDGNSARFSISQHGMGTRSWISFLTLNAYINEKVKEIKEEDEEAENYVMLTMEEPEAHLHPQAQRQLYSQIEKFHGQKIISTHSSSVLAQTDIQNIVHVEKIDGVTKIVNFDKSLYSDGDIRKIQREVLNTRGELLFSNAVVLCEGITEEQALPIYFKEYFGEEAICCGVNVIGIGGKNYKTFLNFIKSFRIPWFIFSDGEKDTIKTVKKAIKSIGLDPDSQLPNVVILDHEQDYEKHLLANGYGELIVKAINNYEGDDNYFNNYVALNNHKSKGRKPTNDPECEKCGQRIYKDIIRQYDGEDGMQEAIYDCCTARGAKAKYATCIAKEIVGQAEKEKRIPEKVRKLLKALESVVVSIKEET